LRNDRRIADYAHRAVHRSAEVTKTLIVAYYGRPPEHSYFIGCSNGGHEALMEAQRYPADFDGIVAVAPWVNPPDCRYPLNWFSVTFCGDSGDLSATRHVIKEVHGGNGVQLASALPISDRRARAPHSAVPHSGAAATKVQ
jgi:pimeloyl-ACP methyl ester carboxylesterase